MSIPEIQTRAILSEIRLRNFKAVREVKIELRPLTVVVGRNSSGKSTLLQSVLAIAQAVSKNSNSRHFPLNGEFVRLGTFEEVKNFQDSKPDAEVSIGFTITHQFFLGSRFDGLATRSNSEVILVAWDGHLGPPADSSNGFATLRALEMRILHSNRPDALEASAVHITRIISEVERNSPGFELFDRHSVRVGETLLKVDARVSYLGTSTAFGVVELSGGLPRVLLREETRFNAYATIWWNEYFEVLGDEISNAKQYLNELRENDKEFSGRLAAAKQATKDINSAYESDNESRRDPGDLGAYSHRRGDKMFLARIAQLSDKEKKGISQSIAAIGEATFREQLRASLKGPHWGKLVYSETNDVGIENLFAFGRSAERFFRNNVKYLGPLREAPKVLYNPGPEKDDLGEHGEYTAAVLHAQSQSKRRSYYPLPDGSEREISLPEALNLWLQEIDLVEKVTARDRGRLGIGLTVTPKGLDREVDLTSVGVGVSQVLPVILLCLMARPGQILVIEQPELHLHPAMQLKLADFLLACALSGRQILIETHSEHIVNRLRLRTIENSSNAEVIRLLFAEQEGGQTTFRVSDVNEFGGLSQDWPSGFLDVGADEATEFMTKSLKKRRDQQKR